MKRFTKILMVVLLLMMSTSTAFANNDYEDGFQSNHSHNTADAEKNTKVNFSKDGKTLYLDLSHDITSGFITSKKGINYTFGILAAGKHEIELNIPVSADDMGVFTGNIHGETFVVEGSMDGVEAPAEEGFLYFVVNRFVRGNETFVYEIYVNDKLYREFYEASNLYGISVFASSEQMKAKIGDKIKLVVKTEGYELPMGYSLNVSSFATQGSPDKIVAMNSEGVYEFEMENGLFIDLVEDNFEQRKALVEQSYEDGKPIDPHSLEIIEEAPPLVEETPTVPDEDINVDSGNKLNTIFIVVVGILGLLSGVMLLVWVKDKLKPKTMEEKALQAKKEFNKTKQDNYKMFNDEIDMSKHDSLVDEINKEVDDL